MKYLSTILFLVSTVSFSQVHLPELSPEAHLLEQVGYTNFHIRYGRPAARERKVMGELVPYKRLWRTGAGKCSFIAFDQPVVINNQTIPAGAYALLTIPDEKEWIVLLNSDTSKIYGEPYEYDQKNEVISLKVNSARTDHYYNSLTIHVDIAKYDAVLYLAWEQTQISFPIKTQSYEKAVAAIHQAVNANPNNPETLSRAAWFYYMNNDDPQQILAWLDKALLAGDERWILQQRFDILERMKKYNEAKKAAERAIGFLKTTKPISWEDGVRGYEERMKSWPAK
jgi:tetratricopeptide (TPR) repeat protein